MNSKFVFDSSPLIHLGKAGLAPLIVELQGDKFALPAVIDEVVKRGRELNYPDASVTGTLVEDGTLEVKGPRKNNVDEIARLHKDIHTAESEVIALASEMKAVAVIDGRVARAIAKIHRVRVEGSYGLILRAVANRSISEEVGQQALGALVSSGWRCDAKLYADLIRSLSEVAKI